MFRLAPALSFAKPEAMTASERPDHDQAASALLRCGFDLSRRNIILAVSGGADSMAMAALVKNWHHDHGVAGSIKAIIVDHGIRAESADEANWVRDQLTDLGVDAEVKTVIAQAPEKGIQAWARAERYKLLAEAARHDNAVVFTAHHQQDQVETIIMRLQAESGLDGLKGMQVVSIYDDMTILRPFLNLEPQMLHSILHVQRIAYVDDPSNNNEQFERIAIRSRLEGFEDEGIPSSDVLQLGRLAEKISRSMRRSIHKVMNDRMGMVCAGGLWIDLAALKSLSEKPAQLLLRDVANALGVSRWPISQEQAQNLYDCLHQKNSDGIAATLAGLEWNIQKGLIWVYPEAEKTIDDLDVQKGCYLFEKRWQVKTQIEGKLTPMGAQRAAALRKSFPDLYKAWAGLHYKTQSHMMPMRGFWQLPVLMPASLRAELSSSEDLLALEDGAIIPHVIRVNILNAGDKCPVSMKLVKTFEPV